MKDFVAIDFETANFNQSSICSEGHYNLDIIANYCGYDLTNHHHALADAEACAVIAMQIL